MKKTFILAAVILSCCAMSGCASVDDYGFNPYWGGEHDDDLSSARDYDSNSPQDDDSPRHRSASSFHQSGRR